MRCELEKQFISQNVRGLCGDKEEEFLDFMRINNIFVCGIQETWRLGSNISENNGFVVVQHGSEKKRRKKGRISGGVAIILSPEAKKAWISAGSQVLHFGDRTLAVKLDILDARNRVVKIFFVVAYFPIGAASTQVRQDFYSQFEQCISSCSADEVLLVAADTNSSMGIRSSVRDGVLGPFGVEYCNKAGKELYDCCATLGLCSATTFFKKPQYQTWKNPRSKLGHQIDHFLVRRSAFARVRDAGRYGGLAVESDHQPIRLTMRMAKNLSKQRDERKETFIDRRLLQQADVRSKFQQELVRELQYCDRATDSKYEVLAKSVSVAARKTLSRSERQRNDWFHLHEASLQEVIRERNNAQRAFDKAQKPGAPKPLKELAKLQASRKAVKREVKQAKDKWLSGALSDLKGKDNPRGYWEGVSKIKGGFSGHVKKHTVQRFRNSEGKLCTSTAENSETLKTHFEKVYNIRPDTDDSVIDELRQRPLRANLDCVPSDEEISKALQQAKKDKATGDSQIPVEFWQALEGNVETETLFKECVRFFLAGRVCPKGVAHQPAEVDPQERRPS